MEKEVTGSMGYLQGGFSAGGGDRGTQREGKEGRNPCCWCVAGQERAASSSAVILIPGVRLVHLPTQSMRGQEHGHINSCQISGNGSAACAANANARAVTRGKHA